MLIMVPYIYTVSIRHGALDAHLTAAVIAVIRLLVRSRCCDVL